jgi:hypothetical protein
VFTYQPSGYKNKSKPRVIRTDGGALIYRGKGDQNMQFASGIEPVDHILFMVPETFKLVRRGV